MNCRTGFKSTPYTFFHPLVVKVLCVSFLTQPVCIVQKKDTNKRMKDGVHWVFHFPFLGVATCTTAGAACSPGCWAAFNIPNAKAELADSQPRAHSSANLSKLECPNALAWGGMRSCSVRRASARGATGGRGSATAGCRWRAGGPSSERPEIKEVVKIKSKFGLLDSSYCYIFSSEFSC